MDGVCKSKTCSLNPAHTSGVLSWSSKRAELLQQPIWRCHSMSSRKPDSSCSKRWSSWFSWMLETPRRCPALQHPFLWFQSMKLAFRSWWWPRVLRWSACKGLQSQKMAAQMKREQRQRRFSSILTNWRITQLLSRQPVTQHVALPREGSWVPVANTEQKTNRNCDELNWYRGHRLRKGMWSLNAA